MPKFSDDWVVDKTLFDYVSGGSCACCGRGFFLPDGIEGMINAISDLETDAANAEIKAVEKSPWPPDMRDQVWSDRVRLRVKMKMEMTKYANFWNQYGNLFAEWCRSLEPRVLKKIFQVPRTEVMDRINTTYGIHSAFGAVLSTVIEQIAHFRDTQYPTDGRGESEIPFEEILCYDRRGGFTIKIIDKAGHIDEEVMKIWLKRMESLGGPILLERSPKNTNNGMGADDVDEASKNAAKPSFRMDRRVLRLLIARFWADVLMEKFMVTQSETEAFAEAATLGHAKSDDV